MDFLKKLLGLGLFRNVMLAIILLLAVLGPFNDGQTYIEGWPLFTSVVAPAMMVIMVFILLLDITMTRVFAADEAEPQRRARLQLASVVDGWGLLLLVITWAPFVARMLGYEF